MKKSNGSIRTRKRLAKARRHKKTQILQALVGSACGLAAAPSSALELGEIRVDSSLGQPLRASIAYALAPNEQLFDFCIFLNPARTANGLPVVSNARVTVTDSAIVLNGRLPIREPMLAMQVSVNCPYTARLAREYMLMIDPPLPSESERVALRREQPVMTPVQTTTAGEVPFERDRPAAVKPTPIPRRSTRRVQDETPIGPGSRYLVQPGDSLSQIVARVENRSVALWPAVNEIFALNPHAFLDNDPNLLKAGSWLEIPNLTGGVALPTVAASTTVVEPVAETATARAYTGATAADIAPEPEVAEPPAELPAETTAQVAETEPVQEPVAEPVADVSEMDTLGVEIGAPPTETIAEPVEPAEPSQDTQLRPGDFVIGTDNPFVVPVGSDDGVIDIPDSELRGPQASQPQPSVAVSQNSDRGISSGWTWLFWLGGAGLAMILGLFLFGRQLREYFGAAPAAMPPLPQRRRDDEHQPPSIADIDYNFDATTITGRKISLDADLEDGDGLEDSDEMDVAQDFAYSATEPQVDMEIPELPVVDNEADETDVLPTTKSDNILDAEVLPAAAEVDEEDYSVSMNVDATKQILDDNTATTKDLQAVLVDTNVEITTDETGEYTLSRSAEYQILEQDYEEELTATQALNKEIEEAARALVQQMDSEGKTSEMPAPKDPDLTAELTANLETQGDAQNEEYAATGTVADDLKVEMPDMSGDETLDVESPMIETPSKKAS